MRNGGAVDAVSDKGIGSNIARIRKAAGLNQSALAERLGTTQATVSRWESGRRMMNTRVVAALASALDCAPGDIMAAPMTLEEMTRRRDGWRQRCEGALGVIRSLKAQNRALTGQLVAAEVNHTACDAAIGRLRSELEGARAEARRFAQECGRLRDKLAETEGRSGE